MVNNVLGRGEGLCYLEFTSKWPRISGNFENVKRLCSENGAFQVHGYKKLSINGRCNPGATTLSFKFYREVYNPEHPEFNTLAVNYIFHNYVTT